MLDGILPDDLCKSIEKLNDETTHVATLFTRFSQSFLQVVIKKYVPDIWNKKGSEVIIDELAKFSQTQIKWFVDTSKGLKKT